MNAIPNTHMHVIDMDQAYPLDAQAIPSISDLHTLMYYPTGRIYGWQHATYPHHSYSNSIGNVIFNGAGQASVVPMEIDNSQPLF